MIDQLFNEREREREKQETPKIHFFHSHHQQHTPHDTLP